MSENAANINEGVITQIIGPAIDVEFKSGAVPEIYDALEIENGES